MGEGVLTAHIWLLATLIPLLDRLFPLRVILRLLTPPGGLVPYRGTTVNRISEAVCARLQRPLHMRRRACLRKGLMLFHFLRLAGLPAELHFGVYPADGMRRRGHCWVTSGSRTLNSKPTRPVAVVLNYGRGL